MLGMIRNNRGLTAVEVIVAAVILVIVSVSLLGLYNSNFGWIVGAGFRTEALDKAKTAIDQLIATGPVTGSTDSITISFPGVSSVTVIGQFVSTTQADGPNSSVSVTLRTFLPN
jgi:hypothetical protein